MSPPVITVENLSKRYVINHQRSKDDGFRHALEDAVRAPLQWLRRRDRNKRQEHEEFWALKDVSFEIHQGQVIGIIGRNGAGKSTLLKILSRITEPTLGRISIEGRVASLLEVGTGFHQELTGRENIFLNGAILGMTRIEIKKKFDEIVAFSEVEKFLDTPVKRYSSGMYVRLAFAVAAHLEPEILMVDEVLAVGDAQFQKKCLGKMKDVASGGRTVIVVAHNLEVIAGLCDQAIYLKDGTISSRGPTDTVITSYLKSLRSTARPAQPAHRRELDLAVTFPKGDHFRPEEPKMIRFTATSNSSVNRPWFLSGIIRDQDNAAVLQFDSRLLGYWYQSDESAVADIELRTPWLKPGRYTIDAFLCVEGKAINESLNASEFTVLPGLPYPEVVDAGAIRHAPVLSDFAISSPGKYE